MTMAAAADTIVLRCELGWAEVREVMAASRLLTLTRRSWLTAGVFFAALLAEAIVLLRFVAARPAAAYGSHRGLLMDELIAGVGLCLLLVCWSALRVWRLSPGRQARQALANGVWPRGTYEYKLRHDGVAWRAPDRSAVFLPWSALAGTCETERLFLLMDAEGRTVRGFIPKTGRSDLPSDAELGRLIRERIRAAIS
jgi:hypothetical protein